jgi:hypothetical protein
VRIGSASRAVLSVYIRAAQSSWSEANKGVGSYNVDWNGKDAFGNQLLDGDIAWPSPMPTIGQAVTDITSFGLWIRLDRRWRGEIVRRHDRLLARPDPEGHQTRRHRQQRYLRILRYLSRILDS